MEVHRLILCAACAALLVGCNNQVETDSTLGDEATKPQQSSVDEAPAAPPTGGGGPYSEAFAADGIWSTPIPAAAQVDPGSAPMIAALSASVERQAAAGTGPGLSAGARAAVYVAGPDVEPVPVQLDTGPWGKDLERALAAGVPIPDGAEPAGGTDEEIVIWQPSSDTYWELFLARQALHSPQFAGDAQVQPGGGLAAGSYEYKVTARSARGETNGRVVSLPATVGEGSSVRISWYPIDGATGYRVYRGPAGGEPGLVASVDADATSFTDSGDPAGARTPPTENTAVTPGSWRAAYGGVIPDVSRSPGYFRDRVGADGTVEESREWGASASGLATAGGLVTKRDVASGEIDHALSMGLPNLAPASSEIAAGRWAYPAQRSDGKSTLATAIPEGARLRLDPALDLGSLGLSPFVRSLAEAAQRYGIYVQDGSAATVLYGEDPLPYMRAGMQNFFDAEIGPRQPGFLADFPWEHLQVLDLELCSDPGRPCGPGGAN